MSDASRKEPPTLVDDHEAITLKLRSDPVFSTVDLAQFARIEDLGAISRYRVGDLIRVPRTGGHFSLGVVVETVSNGAVKVGVQSQRSGRLSFKEIDREAVTNANPLKIGDYIELDGCGFWVSGLDETGEVVVFAKDGSRVDPMELRRRIVERIEGEETAPTIRLTRDALAELQGSFARAPTRPLSISRPLDQVRYVPIESILNADSQHGLVAGNKETDTVYGLKSPVAGGALHTNKGVNYKSFNEDGAALFADKRGRVYFGVFDQAGGEGASAPERGAASAIAAQMFFDRMQISAIRDDDPDHVEKELVDAAQTAHAHIQGRGHGEVTTYVAGRVDSELAVVANVGDSGAMHFDARGKFIEATAAQGIGRILLEGLGMIRDEKPACETYRFKMGEGHYLVVGSDGLFDSKLPKEEIGSLVARSGSAKAATRALRDVVSERMRSKEGKPDNLTVVVIRTGEQVTEV